MSTGLNGSQEVFKGVSSFFKKMLRVFEVSRVFKRRFHECVKQVLRVLQKVLRKSKGCFKEASKVFQGSFREISRGFQ